MPDAPYLRPADQVAEAEHLPPTSMDTAFPGVQLYTGAEIVPPPSITDCPCTQSASQSASTAYRTEQSPDALPWWWRFALFLITFVVFAVLVVILVAQGQNLAVVVGVPAALSAVALGALSRLAVLAHRRRS